MVVLAAQAAETRLDGAAIQALLADHSFAGDDGGRHSEQIFQAAGATYYSVEGAQSQGRWTVRGDRFCSQWPPSDGWSCYEVMVEGPSVIFVSASGKRYVTTKIN